MTHSEASRTIRSPADVCCLLLALGALALVLSFGGWLAYFHARPRRPKAEYGAIGSLRAIANAQTLFREGDKECDEALDYAANLGELVNVGPSGAEDLISEELASGTKDWYRFRIRRLDPEFVWVANADPTDRRFDKRYFGINMTGQVFYSEDRPVHFNSDGSSPDPELER